MQSELRLHLGQLVLKRYLDDVSPLLCSIAITQLLTVGPVQVFKIFIEYLTDFGSLILCWDSTIAAGGNFVNA